MLIDWVWSNWTGKYLALVMIFRPCSPHFVCLFLGANVFLCSPPTQSISIFQSLTEHQTNCTRSICYWPHIHNPVQLPPNEKIIFKHKLVCKVHIESYINSWLFPLSIEKFPCTVDHHLVWESAPEPTGWWTSPRAKWSKKIYLQIWSVDLT